MDCSTPGLPMPHHLPKFAQVHIHCISDALQPSHPLVPSSPPTFNGLFQWVGCLHQMTSFSFSISSSNEYSGLSALKIDWFDLLAVQETFRSLLQHYSLKSSYKRILFPKELKKIIKLPLTPLHFIFDDISIILYIFINFVLFLWQFFKEIEYTLNWLNYKYQSTEVKVSLSAYLMVCIIVLIKLSL